MVNFKAAVLSIAATSAIAAAQRPFTLLPYGTIVQELKELEAKYPQFVELTTAQERYGLPNVGMCGSEPCTQYIVTVTNEALFNEDTPELLVSGLLHGDERAGATIALETLKFLLENYDKNPWIKHLVDTRSIVAVPMANARGYFDDLRGEEGPGPNSTVADPNRDFPFDNPEDDCMNTVAARTINELSLEHLFQVSLTFHGGIQMINYMWAATSYIDQPIAPDDIAQRVMGSVLSATAGSFIEGRYPHGRGIDLLYPVRGGMEDWSYAGSVIPNDHTCNGTGNGLTQYPAEKTQYDLAQLRHINMLVETAAQKHPDPETLGYDTDVLQVEGDGDGHIPRNIRLILTSMDMLQPYLVWTESAQDTTSFRVKPGTALPLSWEVGGAGHVAETRLVWGAAPANGDASKPGFGLDPSELRSTFDDENSFAAYSSLENHGISAGLNGLTRWAGGGFFGSAASQGDKDIAVQGNNTLLSKHLSVHDRSIRPFIPAWKQQMVAPSAPGEYYVMATAVVDQDFSDSTDPAVQPDAPFTHWANVRTNVDYEQTLGNHRVRGQRTWYSKPIKVIVADDAEELAVQAECQDLSPSGVEYLGSIRECAELKDFCGEYEFVQAACPSTCNVCDGDVRPDLNPVTNEADCKDIGGIMSTDGDSIQCEELKGMCATSALVVERCPSTCGRCWECADNTGIVASGGGVSYTCQDLLDAGFCEAAAFIKTSCPISCNGCSEAEAELFPGAYAAPSLSSIIPIIPAEAISTFPPAAASGKNGGSTGVEYIVVGIAAIFILAIGQQVLSAKFKASRTSSSTQPTETNAVVSSSEDDSMLKSENPTFNV